MIGDEGLQILKRQLEARNQLIKPGQEDPLAGVHDDDDDIPELEESRNFETLQQRNEEITRLKDEDYMAIKQKQNQEYIQHLFNDSFQNGTLHIQQKPDQDICVGRHLHNCSTCTFFVNDEYYFITIGSEEQTQKNQYERIITKNRSVLVIHQVQGDIVVQIHDVELNNTFLSQHPNNYQAP